jgi:hypothetical protein
MRASIRSRQEANELKKSSVAACSGLHVVSCAAGKSVVQDVSGISERNESQDRRA